MSITRVGSTKKFADGWDGIFTAKPGRKKGKKTAKKPSAKTAAKKSSKKKPAKIVAPTAPGVMKKKSQPRPKVAKAGGPGDERSKKSAAKRTSKTRTKRVAPELHQMELF